MSAPSNTGGPQDPIAVVSMAREALRVLKEAQVVESVTDTSHLASNVATPRSGVTVMKMRTQKKRNNYIFNSQHGGA